MRIRRLNPPYERNVIDTAANSPRDDQRVAMINPPYWAHTHIFAYGLLVYGITLIYEPAKLAGIYLDVGIPLASCLRVAPSIAAVSPTMACN